MVYDSTALEACEGALWCMFLAVNDMLNGWLSIGILVVFFFISFTILQVQDSEDFLGNTIASLFAVFVLGFLLFLGEALYWQVLVFILLLLAVFAVIKQITK